MSRPHLIHDVAELASELHELGLYRFFEFFGISQVLLFDGDVITFLTICLFSAEEFQAQMLVCFEICNRRVRLLLQGVVNFLNQLLLQFLLL